VDAARRQCVQRESADVVVVGEHHDLKAVGQLVQLRKTGSGAAVVERHRCQTGDIPGRNSVGMRLGYFAGAMVGNTSEARARVWLSISKLSRAPLAVAPSPVVGSSRAVMVM
jgi:hypothetical protein